jgi:farnesyl-diphosphate farnesyltransferase
MHPAPAASDDEFDTASGKNSGTENFPVGSFLIRADLRPHVHAFYQFARAADDISDHPLLDAGEKVRRLDRLVRGLMTDGDDEIKAVADMRASLAETGVSPIHCVDLITAFKRDATQLRYRDWDDLIDYCNHSASPVGRHVLALHGIGKETWKANDALCNALQVINHIQDCADDYRALDRCYIPADMLAAKGGNLADLSGVKCTPTLRATLDAMLDKTEELMVEARQFPAQIPDCRLRMEVSVIITLADRLIALLRVRDPLCDNVKLGKIAVLGATMTGLLRAWR